MVANDKGPSIVLALIWFPLDDWHQRSRVWSRLNVASNVQSNFDMRSRASNNARDERGKLRHCSAIRWFQACIQFRIDFAFIKDIRGRNVEDCLLSMNLRGRSINQDRKYNANSPAEVPLSFHL